MDGRKHPLPRNKIMLRPWQQIEAAAAVVVVIVVVIANRVAYVPKCPCNYCLVMVSPAPLYLRTLWRYTNDVMIMVIIMIIMIIIIIIIITYVVQVLWMCRRVSVCLWKCLQIRSAPTVCSLLSAGRPTSALRRHTDSILSLSLHTRRCVHPTLRAIFALVAV